MGNRHLRSEVVGFYLATALALIAIALGAVVVSRTVARNQALEDAERQTQRLADLTFKPAFETWLRQPTTANLDALNAFVATRKSDGYLTEITVWSDGGRVIYSDNPDDIGQVITPVPEEVLVAIRQGDTSSDFEVEPEASPSAMQADNQGFVEVYVPMSVANEPPMAFEAYFDYRRVNELADKVLRALLPLVLVPLLLLQAIQLPLAIRLARRARRSEEERSALLERALTVSDAERVRFAADLHDGPIQDLAGIGYALGAVAPNLPEKQQPLMQATQDALRRSIESLRALMTDLYPPDLTTVDFEHTIADLARPLESAGLLVEVSASSVPELAEESLRALYRVVRESFANILKHAEAEVVEVTVTGTVLDPRSPISDAVELVIADDGVGVDPERLNRRRDGHLGLRLLRDRVASLGGSLTIGGTLGQGTTITVVLPAVSGLRGRTSSEPLVVDPSPSIGADDDDVVPTSN